MENQPPSPRQTEPPRRANRTPTTGKQTRHDGEVFKTKSRRPAAAAAKKKGGDSSSCAEEECTQWNCCKESNERS